MAPVERFSHTKADDLHPAALTANIAGLTIALPPIDSPADGFALAVPAAAAATTTPDVEAYRRCRDPGLALTAEEAHRLRQGQAVALLRRQDFVRLETLMDESAERDVVLLATSAGRPVALCRLEGAEVRPMRVINI